MRFSPVLPFFGWNEYTTALPSFYWDVYSAEQRIKHICYELCRLYQYSDYLANALNTLGNDVENELESIREDTDTKIANLRYELINLIAELEEGQLQWDVQIGSFTDTITAQRDMFNDVTVHSYNCEQLETLYESMHYTVDGLANSGLNVKGYAVMNHYIADSSIQLTSDLIAN